MRLLPPHSPCSTDAVVRFPGFHICTSASQNTAAFTNGSNPSAGRSRSRQAPHLAALPQPHTLLPTGRGQDHTTLQIQGTGCSYCILYVVWTGEQSPSPCTSQPPSSGLSLLPSQDLGKEQNQPSSSAASVHWLNPSASSRARFPLQFAQQQVTLAHVITAPATPQAKRSAKK